MAVVSTGIFAAVTVIAAAAVTIAGEISAAGISVSAAAAKHYDYEDYPDTVVITVH